jgi:adenosylmethionine---8-amino-7-oxononanoate aminotransferase
VNYESSYKEYSDFDRDHIWHPYTQEKTSKRNSLVTRAYKEFIEIIDQDGNEKKLIDGISSWWVNIHGHCHPYVQEKIKDQLSSHEQVIFAGFTHEPAIKLVEKLLKVLPKADLFANSNNPRTLSKAFFSDNGSTSVEVAIKMALQFFYNKGAHNKKRVITFTDAYHGDTVGTMSVGATDTFHHAFKTILFPVDRVDAPDKFLKNTKTKPISSEERLEAEEKSLTELVKLIEKNPDQHAALIIEPLVQAAGGMKFHSTAYLQKIREICNHFDIFLIADEVFTGFGRTGSMFACTQASIVPDMICLSKGLTAGFMPMGLTFTTKEVYEAFYDDSRLKTFFHGHSYTGNSLSCAAGLASIELFERDNRLDDVRYINLMMKDKLLKRDLLDLSVIKDIRILGAIAVIEFQTNEEHEYLSGIGPRIYDYFLKQNILLRPLGNVLYFLPPYTISTESLEYCLSKIKSFALDLEKSILTIQK